MNIILGELLGCQLPTGNRIEQHTFVNICIFNNISSVTRDSFDYFVCVFFFLRPAPTFIWQQYVPRLCGQRELTWRIPTLYFVFAYPLTCSIARIANIRSNPDLSICPKVMKLSVARFAG